MSETTTPPNDIFGDHKKPEAVSILTTCNPILAGLTDLPPIKGLPEGKVRVRLRANELAPIVTVRNVTSTRMFMVNINNTTGELSRGPELAANYRPAPAGNGVIQDDEIASERAAARIAQNNADVTGAWWTWYLGEDGFYKVEPAKVLHTVQLNDTVLMGQIVVMHRQGQKHGQRDLAVPGGKAGIENPVESGTVGS